MAFPTGWPPRPASGRMSIRFFVSGTATANWSDNAYLFIQGTKANPFLPTPVVKPGGETTTAKVGDRSTPGSPLGAGVDPSAVTPGDTLGIQTALIWSGTIRIVNDGVGTIEFSFTADDNADNEVHGSVKAGEELVYRERFEAGITLRGSGAFRVEAW